MTSATAPARPPAAYADGAASLIRMEGVKKVFLTDEVETHALADVHLEIRQGEYVAIAGPSGCGKTTLLSILGLLDAPSRGATRWPARTSRRSTRPTARRCATGRSASSSRRST
jgi:putative ABC transport system ATP-binding protein